MTQTLSKKIAAMAHRISKNRRDQHNYLDFKDWQKGRKRFDEKGRLVTHTESAKKGKLATKKKDKKWIQKASASIKKRGTKGVCTGPKFGGPSCPPGSRRYNLAKVFRGMARKKKKAATGAMIKAKNSALISHQKAYDLAKAEKGEDRVTKADIAYQRTKHIKGRTGRHATGAMIKANTGQLVRERTRGTGAAVTGDTHVVMKGMDAANTGKLIQVPTRGSGAAVRGNQHYVMEGMDAAKHGKIIKAKTGVSAALAATDQTIGVLPGAAGAGSGVWRGSKALMKLPSVPAKLSRLQKLKNIAKAGLRRAPWLLGGAPGAAALSATMAPGVIDKLTKRKKGATKTKLFGVDIKGAEKALKKREALLKKRNKARGYKGGAEIIAPDYMHVIRPKPTSGGTVLEQKPLNDYTKDLL